MGIVAAAVVLLSSLQGQAIVSPEVHPDRTITFRYKDAGAQKVTVNLEGAGSQPMTKGPDGVWTLTTAPMAPDLYGYSFAADGDTRLDTRNPNYKPNLIWASNVVLVPGNQPWEVRDVPHGTVHHHFYHSKLIGDDRDYLVYTPPGYRAGARQKYPVLYLLHGYSDTAGGWTEVGRAHVILDNLIADRKAKPMIVVMPLGYGVANFHNTQGTPTRPMDWNRNIEFASKAIMTEVLPAVQAEYAASPRPEHRAIAGLSMGGAETLFTALNNPTQFAYMGAFSSGGLNDQFDHAFPKLDAAVVNRNFKVLRISCGTEDGLLGVNRQVTSWLRGKGVKVSAVEQPGAHTWMVWRRDLAAFAASIF